MTMTAKIIHSRGAGEKITLRVRIAMIAINESFNERSLKFMSG